MLSADPLLVAIPLVVGSIAIGFAIAWMFAPGAGGAPHPHRAPPPASWSSGLARTRSNLARRIISTWTDSGATDAWIAQVEEVLLSSDVGVAATQTLLQRWRTEIAAARSQGDVQETVIRGVRDLLASEPPAEVAANTGPHVILVVGVNGVGKTTTIGKLAQRHAQAGRKVMLVAADTFRAAAIEQLSRWADRTGADLIKHQDGADPSAVTFDGMKAATARGADVVIIDTAGRLHVKAHLMEEVKKIARTAGREIEGAPHEVLLVIDATTGQNAINQARVFDEALDVDGVALTKLDGSAKGGVALAIRSELGLPIRYVGLGEGVDDLAEFDAGAFAEALFTESELEPGRVHS